MTRRFVILLILVSVATFGATTAHAQGLPPVFQFFYGSVEINGQPAPVNTTVEARGAGVVTLSDNPELKDNPVIVTIAGQYGVDSVPGNPKLLVQGSIVDGAPIEFYINGEKAECATPDGEWQSSFPFAFERVTRLNLRVGAAVQPTATPTTGVVGAATATPTIRAQVGITDPTPTPGPGPTATRLTTGPTNTPVPGAAPTTQVTAPAGATARPGSPATTLPGSVVATPTGLAPQAAAPAASTAVEPAPAPVVSTAPTVAQVAAVATPLPTRTPASVAQVVTSEPILKGGTPQNPVDVAPTSADSGSGRSVALWGGLGALLIAIAVGVLIKVRR